MSKKGFTLVELLATIVIIAFIMGIVLPSATRVSEENKGKMCTAYETMMEEYAQTSAYKDQFFIELSDLEDLEKVKRDCEGYVTINYAVSPPKYTAHISCSNGCKSSDYVENIEQEKIKINIPGCKNDVIYNGQVQSLIASGEGYVLSNEKRVNIGTQNVVVNIADKRAYAWRADNTQNEKVVRNCELKKRPITLTAKNLSFTYLGTPPSYDYTLSNTVPGENPLSRAVTYKVYNSSGTEVTIRSDSPAGTYTIVPSSAVTNNYSLNIVNGTLTILRKPVDFPTCETKTYTGSSQLLFPAHSGVEYTNSAINGTDAGDHTGDLTPTANYQWSTGTNTTGARTLTCHINQYKPSISINPTNGSVAWDSEATFNSTPSTIDPCKGTITATSADETYVKVSSGASHTNVTNGVAKTTKWKGILKTTGTKINVNFTPNDTANCYSANTVQYTAKVTIATPTITLTEKTGLVYNKSAQSANTATVSPNSSPTITYTYYTNSSCSTNTGTTQATGLASSSGKAPKAAGTWYVKAHADAVTNKTYAADSACVRHSIAKKKATITLGTTPSLTYGTDSELTYTYDGDGTVSCSSSDTSSITCTMDTTNKKVKLHPVKATTSNITITVSANEGDNYLAADNKTASMKVARKPIAFPTCSSKVYSGSSQTLFAAHSSGEYTNSAITGTDAKSYSGDLTPTSNYQWSDGSNVTSKRTLTCTISKSSTTTSLGNISKTYTGSAQAASGATSKLSNDATISGASYTYKYYSNSACTSGESTTAPTNAGTYYVKATLTGTSNYNSSTSGCATYTMNRKAVAFPTCSSKVYSGGSQTLFAAHNSGEYTNSAITGTNVGSYSGNLTPTDNYQWSNGSNVTSARSLSCSITQSTTTTSLSAISKTYNGSAQAASGATSKLANDTSISGASYTYKYYSNDACTSGESTTAPTNAGTYYVKATLTGTDNYASSTSGCTTYTMNRKSVAFPTCSSKVYSGGSQTLFAANSSGEYTNSAITGTDVKSYSGNLTPTSNYQWSDGSNVTSARSLSCSITKSSTTTSLDNISKTYSGSAQAATGATSKLSNDATISGASYTYKYYSNSACTSGESTTAPTNAGTYYVKATLTGTSNYNSSTSGCATYTMNRKAVAFPTCSSKAYSGGSQELFAAHSSGEYTNSAITGTDVKSYSGNLTPTSNYQWSSGSNVTSARSLTCSITKSTTTTSLSAISNTYTGSAQAASGATSKLSNNTSISGGSYTYTYYSNSSCTTTTTTPTSAGTYYVKATLSGTSNYESSTSGCATYTMNRKGVAFPTCSSKTYTASSQTLFAAHSSGEYTNSAITGTTAGDHTGDLTPTSNYQWSSGSNVTSKRTLTCTISKSSTTTSLGNISKTYTGSAQAASGATSKLSNNTNISGGSYTYTYYSNSSCTTTTSTPTNYGTYYVKATLSGTSNYESSTSGCATYSMAKASSSAPTLTGFSVTYDGSLHYVSVSGGSGGTIKYNYCVKSGSSCSGSWSGWSTDNGYRSANNVGEWYVKAKVFGDDNHNNSDETSSVVMSISKASSTAPTLTGFSVTYDGKPHYVSVSGGSGGTIKYNYCVKSGSSCSGSWSGWSTDDGYRGASNAGEWYVKAKVFGDGNHNDSGETDSVVMSISKASSTAPTLTGFTVTYDGNPHYVTVSGGSGGTIKYAYCTKSGSSCSGSWSSWSDSDSYRGATNVGEWYVKAKVFGDGNHNNSNESNTVTMTVNPAGYWHYHDGGTSKYQNGNVCGGLGQCASRCSYVHGMTTWACINREYVSGDRTLVQPTTGEIGNVYSSTGWPTDAIHCWCFGESVPDWT